MDFEWECSNGKCINRTKVCDGSEIGGCGDGNDEENCESYLCLENYIKCGDLKTCVEVNTKIGHDSFNVVLQTITLKRHCFKIFTFVYFFQTRTVCDDKIAFCPDKSDEMCQDQCVVDGFQGRYTMKVNW